MKIQRYNNFLNESLKDKIVGKSKEEVDIAIDKYLDNFEKELPDIQTRELVYSLGAIFNDNKGIINALIDNDIINDNWILDRIIEEIDEDWNGDKEEKRLFIFNLIKDNKDKIDTNRI